MYKSESHILIIAGHVEDKVKEMNFIELKSLFHDKIDIIYPMENVRVNHGHILYTW